MNAEVKVTWTEEWQRTSTTRVDLDDVRSWLGTDEPITDDVLAGYLEAEDPADRTWHPNTMPDDGDEFCDLRIEHVALAAASPVGT